jgi:myo-inositol-1(or 4)-monophosphatase
MDIVTQMDKKAEKFIVQSILAARPDDGLIGEEGADKESTSGITWVIDPLDGTVNYFYGLPGWNDCISLQKDKDGSVVGVVTAPTINSTWWATRGGGAFYNGSKIYVAMNLSNLIGLLSPRDFDSMLPIDIVRPNMLARMIPLVRDIRSAMALQQLISVLLQWEHWMVILKMD